MNRRDRMTGRGEHLEGPSPGVMSQQKPERGAPESERGTLQAEGRWLQRPWCSNKLGKCEEQRGSQCGLTEVGKARASKR